MEDRKQTKNKKPQTKGERFAEIFQEHGNLIVAAAAIAAVLIYHFFTH
jgi:hypothetical protein